MRRIGVLMYLAADDAEGQARVGEFTLALKQLGWSDGRNLRIDTRWATADDIHRQAAELAALAPDVLVAGNGTATVAPLLQATRTVPVVFVNVIDPVGSGFVASLAKPGGNATGFTIYEFSMSGKWLELLKEIAPNVTRVAVLRDPAVASGMGQFGAIQIVAPLHMSAFGGKAEMTLCGNPLLRSLLGVKRTWVGALQMSAYDPKRTSAHHETAICYLQQSFSILVAKPLKVGEAPMKRTHRLMLAGTANLASGIRI